MKVKTERECALGGCSVVFKKWKTTDKFCSPQHLDQDKKNRGVEKKKHSGFTRVYSTDKDVNKNKKKAIKKVSSKLLKQQAIYRPLRDKYMEDNPICGCNNCYEMSEDLHHMNGRTGYYDKEARLNDIPLISDVRFFMAVCRKHHNWIHHVAPERAKALGYIKVKL